MWAKETAEYQSVTYITLPQTNCVKVVLKMIGSWSFVETKTDI